MATEESVLQLPQRLPWHSVARLRHMANLILKEYPVVWLTILFLVLIFPALTADFTAPHHPLKQQLSKRLTPPVWDQSGEKPGTWSNILGTDKQGRDILSRIMHGSRISLMVSLSALAIGGTIGTTLGLISGYFGRWVDHLIMRVVDTFLALPLILMALVIVAVFGPSFYTAIGVISVLLWSRYRIAVMPGLAIMFVVLSMNMMGDWLRDKLDPKLRQV